MKTRNLIVIVLSMMMFACGKLGPKEEPTNSNSDAPTEKPEEKPEDVVKPELTALFSDLTIAKGSTITLPDMGTATFGEFDITTDNETIASVKDGALSGNSAGSCSIILKMKNFSDVTASINLHVVTYGESDFIAYLNDAFYLSSRSTTTADVTIHRGNVAISDEVKIISVDPTQDVISYEIKSITMSGKSKESASAGDQAALALGDVDVANIKRGYVMVSSSNSPYEASSIVLCDLVITDENTKLKGADVLETEFNLVTGNLFLSDGTELTEGSYDNVIFSLVNAQWVMYPGMIINLKKGGAKVGALTVKALVK